MKKLIILLFFIVCTSSVFSQSSLQDESPNVGIRMGLSPCFAIRDNGECLQVLCAPGYDCFDFYYKLSTEKEYTLYKGEAYKFNDFLCELIRKKKLEGISVAIRVEEKPL